MAVLPTKWLCFGSGNNIAPRTCWLIATAASVNMQATCSFYNSSGGLVTISGCSFGIWDVTANSSVFAITLNNINTINFNANTNVNGHTFASYLNYQAGALPDHAIITHQSIGSSFNNYPCKRFWRSGAWVAAGPQIQFWRGGAWVPYAMVAKCNSGTKLPAFWRSGAWAQP